METDVVRGVRWTFLGYVMNRAVGIVTTLVLARLLIPLDFGLVAFATVVIGVARYTMTLGVGPAVVVRQDLDRQDLGTALSVLLLAHAGAGLFVAAVSPGARLILDHGQATAVTLALAGPLFFGGLSAFHDAVLQRELEFRRQFAARVAQVLVLGGVTIALAAAGSGAWSLVIGQAAAEATFAVFVVLLSPFRTRPRWNSQTARSLWRSGRGFTLQGAFSFIEQNVDYFVVGATLGARSLGIYGMGYRLSELPYSAVVDPISQATFPGFARLRLRNEDPSAALLSSLKLTVLCALPIAVLLAGSATPFVNTFFGSDWDALVGVLPILAVWGGVRSIQATLGWFLNSWGFAEKLGIAYGLMLIVSIPILVANAHYFGLPGVAASMLLDVIVMLIIGVRITHSDVGVPWNEQWRAVRPAVLGAIPAGLGAAGVSAFLPTSSDLLTLVVASAVGGAVYLTVASRLEPGLLAQATRQVRRVLRSGAAVRPAGHDLVGAEPSIPTATDLSMTGSLGGSAIFDGVASEPTQSPHDARRTSPADG